nr:TPA_asm: RNA-dependent RNA polymerase [Triaenopho phenuili virus 2]
MSDIYEAYRSSSINPPSPNENQVLLIEFLSTLEQCIEPPSMNTPAMHASSAEIQAYDWNIAAACLPGGLYSYELTLSVGASAAGAAMSLRNEVKQLTYERARTFPHDFTFHPLAPSTDIPLRSHFPSCPHNLTPDFMLKFQNCTHVVEFTTSRSSSPRLIERALILKWSKYAPVLADIRLPHGERISFHVILVHPTGTLSTLPFSEEFVNEIVTRYRVAVSVQTDWNIETEEGSEEIALLRNLIRGVDHPSLYVDPSPERQATRQRSFKECMEDARTEISRKDTVSIFKTKGKRMEIKPIIRTPLSIPFLREKGEVDLTSCFPVLYGDSPLAEMWQNAFFEVQMDPHNFMAMSDLLEEDDSTEPLSASYKRKRFKVQLSAMSDDLRLFIGLDGVQAKKLSATDSTFQADLLSKRKGSQEAFSLDTLTDDIDHLIENSWFSEASDHFYVNSLTSRELLESSTSDAFKPEASIMGTKLIAWAHFVSVLAQQIIISKQSFTKHDEFTLQPVPGYEALILVKPTSAEGHIFFSVLCKAETSLKSTCSPTVVELHDEEGSIWEASPFQSVRFSALESWIKLPYRLLCLSKTISEIKSNKEVENISKITTLALIAIHNKPETEEVFTLSRFVYMEMFRLRKNPRKIFTKLPDTPKSRFTIWALKKILKLISFCENQASGLLRQRIHLERVDIEGDSETSELHQEVALIPSPAMLDDSLVNSLDEILIECYAGYMTNKNQDQSLNQNLRLYKKLFLMEEKNLVNGSDAQLDGVFTGKTHEWSRTLMRKVGRHCEQKFGKMMGNNFKEVIYKEYLLILSRSSILELATLKSTNIATMEDPHVARTKLLPRMYEKLNEMGWRMSDAVSWALQEELDTGFLISVFKKAQHGGIREISIMNLQSRILQYAMEVLGRVLCSKFTEESMSHPSEKNSPLLKHHKKLIHMTRGGVGIWKTACSSSDAKQWNQTLSVAKFAYLIEFVLPSESHGFINRILSMWLRKMIILDPHSYDTLLDLSFKSKDEAYNTMAHRVREGIAPFLPGKPFFKIESGMLQGLLHFVSSFFHVATLDAWREEVKRQLSVPHLISFLVSSDDSGVIISVKAPNSVTSYRRMYGELVRIEASRLAWTTMTGILTSFEKSTLLCPDIFEFNSVWTQGLSQARASIKFADAAITLADSGTLISRQEQLTSSRQQLLESGISISTCRDVCFYQGLFYYMMLGSDVHPKFPIYAWKIQNTQDVYDGYYLVDEPFLSGVVTVNYLLWALCKRSNFGEILAGALSEDSEYMNLARSGSVIASSHLSFVRSKMYNAILEQMEKRSDVIAMMNENPEILFRAPNSSMEMRVALLANYTNTKVVYSLARDRQYEARVFAASAYMLSSNCMRTGSAWLEDLATDEGAHSPKTSLLKSAHRTKARAAFTEEVERLFFPQKMEYERILDTANQLAGVRLQKLQTAPQKNYTRVTVVRADNSAACTLYNACSWTWGYQASKVSAFLLTVAWERYKAMYPWLRETLAETMTAGNFDNVIQLKEILVHEGVRGRILNVNTCNAYGSSSSLMGFIRNNWRRGWKMGKAEERLSFSRLQHLVTQLSWTQFNQDIQSSAIRSFFRQEFTTAASCPDVLKPFSIWSRSESVRDFLREAGTNQMIIGGYRLRGIYVPGKGYVGRSIWEGSIKGVQVAVTCKDSILTRVLIQGYPSAYYKMGRELRILAEENHWKMGMNSPDGYMIDESYVLKSTTRTTRCCKVSFTNEMYQESVPEEINSISASVGLNGQLRLLALTNENRVYTLYSWVAPAMIDTSFDMVLASGVVQKIIANKPLSSVEFRSFVQNCIRKRMTNALDTIRVICCVQWKSQDATLSKMGVETTEQAIDAFAGTFEDLDDLEDYADSEDDYMGMEGVLMEEECLPMDESQLQLQEEEPVVEGPFDNLGTIIKGLDITPDVIAAFERNEKRYRCEYVRLISILPVGAEGAKMQRAVYSGTTSDRVLADFVRSMGFPCQMEGLDENLEEYDFF